MLASEQDLLILTGTTLARVERDALGGIQQQGSASFGHFGSANNSIQEGMLLRDGERVHALVMASYVDTPQPYVCPYSLAGGQVSFTPEPTEPESRFHGCQRLRGIPFGITDDGVWFQSQFVSDTPEGRMRRVYLMRPSGGDLVVHREWWVPAVMLAFGEPTYSSVADDRVRPRSGVKGLLPLFTLDTTYPAPASLWKPRWFLGRIVDGELVLDEYRREPGFTLRDAAGAGGLAWETTDGDSSSSARITRVRVP